MRYDYFLDSNEHYSLEKGNENTQDYDSFFAFNCFDTEDVVCTCTLVRFTLPQDMYDKWINQKEEDRGSKDFVDIEELLSVFRGERCSNITKKKVRESFSYQVTTTNCSLDKIANEKMLGNAFRKLFAPYKIYAAAGDDIDKPFLSLFYEGLQGLGEGQMVFAKYSFFSFNPEIPKSERELAIKKLNENDYDADFLATYFRAIPIYENTNLLSLVKRRVYPSSDGMVIKNEKIEERGL